MNPTPQVLEEKKQIAKSAVMEASEAAEQFRHDFKVFLGQVFSPITWKEGLKLLMDGGVSFLKDLQEILTERNWTPDKFVLRLNKDLETIVQKHPELKTDWENVQVSFKFAKMKTDRALHHLKNIAKAEYGKFDQNQVVKAVWSGVKEEIKLDVGELLRKLKLRGQA